jgi:hypothetical protein
MADLLIHQRCWNHASREAVCRCPACGRYFCRECVTEHESRLLCAACLRASARTAPRRRARFRALIAAIAALGSVVFSWLIFYVGGEMLLEFTARMEQTWLLR